MSLCCPPIIKLSEASLHPPTISSVADDVTEIPWVLIEEKAYVADCSNSTTAYSYTKCGKQIQATFVVARPPRVSYICIFCRCSVEEGRELQEMIPLDPEVIATDDNLVLLRIVVRPEDGVLDGADLYIYSPAGPGGPSLTRLERPPGDCIFGPYEVGLLSGTTDHDESSRLSFLRPHGPASYTVAALCDDVAEPGRGRFVLYLYSSKLQTWSTTTVTVEDQQFQQYQREGRFFHINTKVISIGGEGGTVGFVDLWRGILLCDLFRIRDSPRLRYIPLPGPRQEGMRLMEDPRIYRDIAVDKGRFKYIHQQLLSKPSRDFSGQYIKDRWMSAIYSRRVTAASRAMEDAWEMNCKVESFMMDVDNKLNFEILLNLQGNESRATTFFNRVCTAQPTLTLHGDGHTACFMVKVSPNDDKSWVVVVDMMQNNVQEVAEFTTERYTDAGFAYKHSTISKYLKRASGAGTKANLKRQGMMLSGSASKKQPSTLVSLDSESEVAAEAGEEMMFG